MFLLWVKEAEKEIEIPPRAMDNNTRTPNSLGENIPK
jgi:hypothetical protein